MTFVDASDGSIDVHSGEDSCYLELREDSTFSGWINNVYHMEKSSGTWEADDHYFYFVCSEDGRIEQLAWMADNGQPSKYLTLSVSGETGTLTIRYVKTGVT